MPKFIVSLVRTSHRHKDVEIEAENREAAEELALDKAGDYDFPSEKSADYDVLGSAPVTEELVA